MLPRRSIAPSNSADRVTWRDTAPSNFVPVVASIQSGSTGPLASFLVARATSTNVTMDPSLSNTGVSTCPHGPVSLTVTIFKNAHDAHAFCM
ncbi:hypothetical protein EVAR_60909_1 [Eumeta japonica]|uniref:Uncharacterized protein n=1 Tax=Eumeta variegata TaxID=151549 RepID=A0A4C1ZJX6_EUMVA|nr:hypothetical protein EVAR_60909_1 [Eumeta japonica]